MNLAYAVKHSDEISKISKLVSILEKFHLDRYYEIGKSVFNKYTISLDDNDIWSVYLTGENNSEKQKEFENVDTAIDYLLENICIDKVQIKLVKNLLNKKDSENKTLMTDFYELTTSQTYFNEGKVNEKVYFDGFFRTIPFKGGYALMGGVDDIINYINNLHFSEEDIEYLRSLDSFTEEFLEYLKNFKFNGDISIIPDGTPIFGNEPLITVKANIIEAQIIETAVLAYLNGEIKFTTAARRLVDAAKNIPVIEFGARRADGVEASILASKCAIIGGCIATSNVLAGKKYGLKVVGTMPHAEIEEADSEYEAFLSYAKAYPNNCSLLVDTYDTLKSGIPNAIRVAKEYLIPNGYRLKGIRIDSGDLAYLTKEARKMLDMAGLTDTKITVSNGLTSEAIIALINDNAPIDMIGVGDNISAPNDRVGVVYKLVAKEENNIITPKIKLSNDTIKTINPGYKKVYRFYDKKSGYAIADIIALADQLIPKDEYTLIDPSDELNKKAITNYDLREIQVPLFRDGEPVYEEQNVEEKQAYCKDQMDTLYPEIRRQSDPHMHIVDLTKELLDLKRELIKMHKDEILEMENNLAVQKGLVR